MFVVCIGGLWKVVLGPPHHTYLYSLRVCVNHLYFVIVSASHHGDGCEGGVSCLSSQSDWGGEGELKVILLLGEQPLEEGGNRQKRIQYITELEPMVRRVAKHA